MKHKKRCLEPSGVWACEHLMVSIMQPRGGVLEDGGRKHTWLMMCPIKRWVCLAEQGVFAFRTKVLA